MNLKRTSRLRLVRWHRRFGLTVVAFLVLLAATGILINHADQLGFDRPVENSAVLNWYGIESPDQIFGANTTQGWVSQLGPGLYWRDQRVAQCEEQSFVGALSLEPSSESSADFSQQQIILACRQVLFFLDGSGQLEEKLDALFGLPVPITGLLKTAASELLIRVDAKKSDPLIYKFNPETGQWAIVSLKESYEWPGLELVPADLKAALVAGYTGSDISWERVLLDLHSGRLFGALGNWVLDIVAILVLVLAISGLRLWRPRVARK